MKVTKRFSRSGGGLGGGWVPRTGEDGGGGGGEKILFDDGQVKVTESLVTIGAPWNKAFAVREITSVIFGKNRSNELGVSISRTANALFQGCPIVTSDSVTLTCPSSKKTFSPPPPPSSLPCSFGGSILPPEFPTERLMSRLILSPT